MTKKILNFKIIVRIIKNNNNNTKEIYWRLFIKVQYYNEFKKLLLSLNKLQKSSPILLYENEDCVVE
jgi:hypothetical protein